MNVISNPYRDRTEFINDLTPVETVVQKVELTDEAIQKIAEVVVAKLRDDDMR